MYPDTLLNSVYITLEVDTAFASTEIFFKNHVTCSCMEVIGTITAYVDCFSER